MLDAIESNGSPPRSPVVLPEADRSRESGRAAQMRIRRAEDAWAMHACHATGFAAGEAACLAQDG